MLRNSASAHPELPPQQYRGSPYHIPDEEDHGYQSPRQQHERSTSSTSTIATPPHRENAFNAPRPSLLPYQEYHSGFTDDDLAASSPLSPSSYSHRRQTSFSNLLPLALRNRTPSPTRKTSVLAGGGDMPFTGDGRSRPGTAAGSESASPRGLAGWLSGTTTTVAAGNLSSRMGSRTTPDVTPTRLRKNTTTTTALDSSANIDTTPSAASRFMSALSTRLAPQQPQPPPTHPSLDSDPLYNLDIDSALFPSPSDRDAFSPAAFKNLHLNAAGWLQRYQAAYRSLALADKEAESLRVAERDELEEAATRAAHLKMQLEGMARRAAEQEEAMRLLVEELVAERRGREEERVLRRRLEVAAAAMEGVVGEQQEEEGGEEWREREGKRKSGGSGESWGETDEEESESVDESVFSRSRSPTTTTGTVDGGSVVDVPLKSGTGTVRAQRGSAQMSTFQKIFKNIAGDADEASGCGNCRGKDASVAWDTVSLLRDENRHLKQRVGQLEVAVEGALDMVNGLGL